MKLVTFLSLLALTAPLLAEEKRGDTPDAPDAPPSTPAEQLAQFHVPPGFEVQLVAAEPEIQKPINLNFDAAGRLWVSGSELYPWPARTDAKGQPIPGFDKTWEEMTSAFRVGDQAPEPPPVGRDTVRILSDFAPDGRARKIVTFADNLNIPTGLQPLPRKPGAKGETAIVFSIPNIWRMEDTDGDGHADQREPLYEGFSFTDTHGMSSNYLYWIDGWIYGCHGFRNRSEVKDRTGRVTVFDSGNTYRFRPDGSQIESYTHGQTNPFGLTVDPLGNFFSADSHSKPVMLLIRGGYYAGIGKQHDGLGFAPTITDDDHGSSGIAGIAYYADDKFPEEYRGNLFNGNPVTRRINRDRLEWHGSTPKAIRMPDFLTCDDPWFRPVQVKLGPDGALWIADFYNPIIGHYEVPLTDPRRDHRHGRIWRIVWKGEGARAEVPGSAPVPGAGVGAPPPRTSEGQRPQDERTNADPSPEVRPGETPRPAAETGALPEALPDLTTLDAKALIEKLGDANITTRTLATNELVERVGKQTASTLHSIFTSGHPWLATVNRAAPIPEAPAIQRVHAMWALARIGGLNSLAVSMFSHSAKSNAPLLLRAHLAHELADREEWHMGDVETMDGMLDDSDPVVLRLAATGTRLPNIGTVKKLLDHLAQAARDDRQLAHALRIAIRNQLAKPRILSGIAASNSLDVPARETLADVSLAVNSSDSATFLLAHLGRTKLATPRAGEYLRHAVLHLPEGKLGAVSALLQPLADAPLSPRLALADGLGQAARERGWKLPDELALWMQRTLLAALESPDAPLADRAIAALRETTSPEKFEPLRRMVLDPQSAGPRRAAALEAAWNLAGGPELALQSLAEPTSLPLRKKAAELLGRTPGDSARAAMLGALPTAPTELAIALAASLAKTDADFTALLDLLEAGKASPGPLRNRLIAILVAGRAAPLRARAAALTKDLPPEDARLDKVIAECAETFRKAKPDATHGAQVFQQHCAGCHRFRNAGGNVGPNLDGVAARGVQRLVEDILDPNRNVDPAFHQTVIETNAGQIFFGANLRDDGSAITLTDAAGKDAAFAKADVKSRTASKFSLMPPGFESLIAPVDFQDLLAYLLEAGVP